MFLPGVSDDCEGSPVVGMGEGAAEAVVAWGEGDATNAGDTLDLTIGDRDLSAYHCNLRLAEGFGFDGRDREGVVEAGHQGSGGGVIDEPEACHRRFNACLHGKSGKAEFSLFIA